MMVMSRSFKRQLSENETVGACIYMCVWARAVPLPEKAAGIYHYVIKRRSLVITILVFR